MSRQHLSWQHLSISGISQLLLTRFWPNFKGRFLGLSWTDFNYRNNIWPGNICPGNICPNQEYLNCYWPDFDKTLNIGSWDYLELISTVAVTFVEATFVLATLSISEISQLLLTRLWLNFKGRFLGLSWTDFNYCSNICPGNICPGNICPYQEYLSCYWPNFDQTLKVGSWIHFEQI